MTAIANSDVWVYLKRKRCTGLKGFQELKDRKAEQSKAAVVKLTQLTAEKSVSGVQA